MAQRKVSQCARPLQNRLVGNDVQETVPMDLSPVAKEYVENPPAEPILDSEPPKPFAQFARAATKTLALGETGEGSGTTDPKDIPAAETTQVAEALRTTEQEPEQLASKVSDAEEAPATETPVEAKPDAEADVFHADSVGISRQEQYAAKTQLEAEKKKRKTSEQDPEDFVEENKTTAKAKAKSKGKDTKVAQAAAKKATKKAMADLQKKLKAEQKAKEKAEKQVKKAEAKAEKAKAAKQTKETKETKEKAKAGKETKTTKRKAKEQKEPEDDQELPGADTSADSASNAAVAGDQQGKTSFARRNRPKTNDPGCRWDAIKEAFNENLLGKLANVSTMEAVLLRLKVKSQLSLAQTNVN